MQKKLFMITAVAVLLLSACTKEKTHTVREFLHDPELLKTTLAFCNDNPGERMALPNCVNSNSAMAKRYSGSSLSECFQNKTVDHPCIDAFLDKWNKE